MDKNKFSVNINVLAYNEEKHIISCLDSIQKSLSQLININAKVKIICNGCTDNTYSIANSYCKNKNNWHAIEVLLGDKANAWNLSIEYEKQEAVLTIFIDGDCVLSLNSIENFIKKYHEKPEAYIIAAIPLTKGRTSGLTCQKTINGESLSGNLYALTPSFLNEVYKKDFKLPVGLIGDDSLLAWVCTHNFKLSNGFKQHQYLVGCEGAGFYYHRLTPTSINNMYLYIRRLARYSLRHLQQNAIKEHLTKHDDFSTLPKTINELYGEIKTDHLRLNSIYSVFDVINYCKIKKYQNRQLRMKINEKI